MVINPDTGEGDLVRAADNSIVDDDGLETLVTISLWTDAPARDGDGIDPSTERRGYWFDAYDDDEPGVPIGSRLWTVLERKPLSDSSLSEVKALSEEALAWFVESGAARQIDVATERTGDGGATLTVTVYRPSNINSPYTRTWDLHFALR